MADDIIKDWHEIEELLKTGFGKTMEGSAVHVYEFVSKKMPVKEDMPGVTIIGRVFFQAFMASASSIISWPGSSLFDCDIPQFKRKARSEVKIGIIYKVRNKLSHVEFPTTVDELGRFKINGISIPVNSLQAITNADISSEKHGLFKGFTATLSPEHEKLAGVIVYALVGDEKGKNEQRIYHIAQYHSENMYAFHSQLGRGGFGNGKGTSEYNPKNPTGNYSGIPISFVYKPKEGLEHLTESFIIIPQLEIPAEWIKDIDSKLKDLQNDTRKFIDDSGLEKGNAETTMKWHDKHQLRDLKRIAEDMKNLKGIHPEFFSDEKVKPVYERTLKTLNDAITAYETGAIDAFGYIMRIPKKVLIDDITFLEKTIEHFEEIAKK